MVYLFLPVKAEGCSRNGTLFDLAFNATEDLAPFAMGVLKARAEPRTARVTINRIILSVCRLMTQLTKCSVYSSDEVPALRHFDTPTWN
jgi:hypothetical protein